METPRGKLTLKRAGALTSHIYRFTPPAIIGRFDPSIGPIDVDLGTVEEGGFVSRKHARIDFTDGVWTITDLGSYNGTFLLRDDFEKVDTAELTNGCEIALGNARLWFEIESPIDQSGGDDIAGGTGKDKDDVGDDTDGNGSDDGGWGDGGGGDGGGGGGD